MALCRPAGTALSAPEARQGHAGAYSSCSPCGRRARPGVVASGLSHQPSQLQPQPQPAAAVMKQWRWRPATRPSRRRRSAAVAAAAAAAEGQQLLGGVTAPVARQLRIPVGDREVGVQVIGRPFMGSRAGLAPHAWPWLVLPPDSRALACALARCLPAYLPCCRLCLRLGRLGGRPVVPSWPRTARRCVVVLGCMRPGGAPPGSSLLSACCAGLSLLHVVGRGSNRAAAGVQWQRLHGAMPQPTCACCHRALAAAAPYSTDCSSAHSPHPFPCPLLRSCTPPPAPTRTAAAMATLRRCRCTTPSGSRRRGVPAAAS